MGISRLMEKENKKARDAAKKERNEVVRELVKFIQKRDKRPQEYAKKLAKKRELNNQKTAEKRKKQLDAQAKALQDALKQVDEGNGGFGMANMEDELRVLEERLDAEDDDELFCIACNKEMRNEKAFAAHRKQKKHLENVSALRETLLKEEMINSDELKSDSDSTDVSINQEATVPEENKILEPDAKPKDVPPKRKQQKKKTKGSSKKLSK